jgi:hypothetical protein
MRRKTAGKADFHQATLDACTQLMGGEAAEDLLLGEATCAADDRRQATELAQLICKTPAAVGSFITFCRQQAIDTLNEHVLAMMSLTIVPKIRRTIDGADKIDQAIAHALAGEAMVYEHIRRRQWRARVVNAGKFKPE